MEEKDVLQKIAIYLQKKYNGFNAIKNLTDQLQEALQYDDVVTIRLLIAMRQEEMDQMDQMDQEYKVLLAGLTEQQKKGLEKGDTFPFSPENFPLLEKIKEIKQRNRNLLSSLIEQDKIVNRKLAGDKTYYS